MVTVPFTSTGSFHQHLPSSSCHCHGSFAPMAADLGSVSRRGRDLSRLLSPRVPHSGTLLSIHNRPLPVLSQQATQGQQLLPSN
jgi:hypothetical protein